MQSSPPTEAEIAARTEERKKAGDANLSYVVAFNGIDNENKHILTQKIRFLGGSVCEQVSECTHLVTPNGRRTERLLEAICLGKNIVNPYWVVHGYECRQWMVEPSRGVLKKLICIAGGIVHDDRPAPADIEFLFCQHAVLKQMHLSSSSVVSVIFEWFNILLNAISSLIDDFSVILSGNFAMYVPLAVYNADFVLIALIRQELEPHPLYRVNTASLAKPPVPQPATSHSHYRPVPSRPMIDQQPQPHRVKA
ncbi:hypothetical protein DICVIV_08194 [Dictyocaulus viviparus]|uniref:PAX-interacting protein 1 n=1 Tax=Dictyocaulus viviparus TaxID=29172 RepID=A0A0D8XMB0_DICVI|nr:hypothetical protein DICVIV_08194 [Dictyocaulus viviparus]